MLNLDQLDSLDIRHLRILKMLLVERSVSRVADQLLQSQPSVSGILKRLRTVFNDQLLVRTGPTSVLTDRGQEILDQLEHVMDGLTQLIDPNEDFDPAKLTRQIRISAANCFEVFLIPKLTAAFRKAAPLASLEFVAPSFHTDFTDELKSGNFDAVIGNWPVPPATLKHSALIRSDIACLLDASHPLAHQEQMSLEQYLSIDHLSPTPHREMALSPIDGTLAQMRMPRSVRVCIPDFSLVPLMLPGSDLALTTGLPFAQYLARHGDLRVVRAPAELGTMDFYLLWHERSQESRYHQWLRKTIRQVARQDDLFTLPGYVPPTAEMTLRGRSELA